MAGLIACQIVFSREQYKSVILSQIIILGASIPWSQLLLYPTVIGVDPWYHQNVTLKIIEFATIPDGGYSHLPLFHLIIAINSLFLDLNYKIAAMFSVSIAQIVCNVLFIYLLGIFTTKNNRVGLFSALMVILADHHIYMSYWSIPNGFAAVIIPIVLYLILKKKSKARIERIFIILLLLLALIFAHSITSICMSILLISMWLLSEGHNFCVNNKKTEISIILPVFYISAMFTWWSYASGHIFELARLIKWGFSRDVFITQATTDIWTEYVQSIPNSEQIFNQLGMFLFFSLSFIGVFYMFSTMNKKNIIYAIIAIIPLFIGFFSLIGGFSVIEHRWWYFAQLLLSVPLGMAIALFFNIFKDNPLKTIGFLICISLFSFTLIMSPAANTDNPIFSPNTVSSAASIESELHVCSILEEFNGITKTDTMYAARIYYIWGYQTESFDQNIYENDYSGLKNQITLVRNAITMKPFMFYQTVYKLDYDLNNVLIKNWFSKIYHSGTVQGYV
jgi:hypothetical protein